MSFFKKLKERFSGEAKKESKQPDSTEKDTDLTETSAEQTDTEQAESRQTETEEPPVVEQADPDHPEAEQEDKGQPDQPAAEQMETEQEEVNQTDEKSEQQLNLKPEKYKSGLSKTRNAFAKKINDLVARYRTVDEDFFEDLEEVLISADVGFSTVMELVDELKMEVKRRNIKDTRKVREVISEKLVEIYYGDDEEEEIKELNTNPDGLSVVLFVGVNGVGKTTTIGKMAHKLKQEGKSVMLAAGDTFRAGAIEQLEVWGERAGVEVIKHSAGSDPAAVVYDGIRAAQSRKVDVLLCDTAGRLQNKVNLMNELGKVKRVIEREIPGAPHEVLLVLDATTGQNAMSQAKTFSDATDVSGIVLTKLDGTAKGGIVLAIRKETEIPVKFVGLGEKVTDLQVFDAHAFVYGLFADMLDEEGE